jgi:hypothetical protein
MRWRLALCAAADVEVVPSSRPEEPRPVPAWWEATDFPLTRMDGDWPEGEPADPLRVLIDHSDCDGWIRHRHTLPLAERLRELLPALSNDGPYPTHTDRAKCEQFIAGLVMAHESGEDVEFR